MVTSLTNPCNCLSSSQLPCLSSGTPRPPHNLTTRDGQQLARQETSSVLLPSCSDWSAPRPTRWLIFSLSLLHMGKAPLGRCQKQMIKVIRKEILGELVPFLAVVMSTSHKPGHLERTLYSLGKKPNWIWWGKLKLLPGPWVERYLSFMMNVNWDVILEGRGATT